MSPLQERRMYPNIQKQFKQLLGDRTSMPILSSNAEQVAQSRYFMEGEDWEKCTYRVASSVAIIEKDKEKYEQAFHEMIYNMEFIPGGRILRNAGRPKGNCYNCFNIPINDSREEIGEHLKNCLITWGTGGGIGCNWSSIRPKNSPIITSGGQASGPVSFLEATDALAATIESGGQRRSAALASLDITHPDIFDFIDAKLVHGKLSHFNISVNINNDFLVAVESNGEIELIFNQQVYKKVKARTLWSKILKNMLNHAEPGLLNTSNLYKNNSYSYANVTCTNPCLPGDALIYTADGRGNVPIKQLTQENRDVPVFCINEVTNKLEVQTMRNPRITGYKQKIYKVTLDNGMFFRCTGNHKIRLLDGTYKEAINLLPNDRLYHPIKYYASLNQVISKKASRPQNYIWLSAGKGSSYAEHRLIAEFKLGRKLNSGEVVHHCDYNAQNNDPNNLKVMSKKEHHILHTKDMLGNNNPMIRFPEKNWLIKQDHSGSNNGRYKGVSQEKVYKLVKKHMLSLNRKITKKEWIQICKDNGYPYSKYSLGTFSSCDKMLTKAAEEIGFKERNWKLKMYKRYLELKDTTNLDIFFEDGSIYVNKTCETCKNKFVVKWYMRERAYCTRKCAANSEKQKIKQVIGDEKRQKEVLNNQIVIYNTLKNILGRDPLKKEWEIECKTQNIPHRIRVRGEVKHTNVNEYCLTSYSQLKDLASTDAIRNFKVISVELDGYEDVYNGTVDIHHNYLIHVGDNETKSKKLKQNYIVSENCGELPLEPYSACCLGSLILPQYISEGGKVHWKKLEDTIKLAVRFLDNVIDVTRYELKQVDIAAHRSRRIGLGGAGLAEFLFAKKVRYGTEESISEIERLVKFIRNVTYQSLVELSIEKGSFPAFDHIAYGKASFIRKLPAALRSDIKKHGSRCVTALSWAPTGTISLLPEVSSGCEPLFARAYKRKDRVGTRIYIHPAYRKLIEDGNLIKQKDLPDWFVDAYDLKPQDHLEVQSIITKYIDSAVSKTVNLPKETTAEQLSSLLLEYIYDLKGVTVYRDGSREGQVLNRIPHEEILKAVKDGKIIDNEIPEEATQCTSGKCDI